MRFGMKILSASALLLAMGVASAQPLTLSDAWVRWLPGGIPAAAYFTLHNGGDKAIELVGASAPGYGKVMLHQSIHQDGMSKMVHVASLDVKSDEDLKFAPNGYHIMLMQPDNNLKPGDTLPIALIFADGSKLTRDFEIRSATGE